MTKEPWRMVKNRSWDRYKKIITDFLDWDAGRQTITWAKNVNQLLSHAEDSIPKYYNIQFSSDGCLVDRPVSESIVVT